MDLHRTHRACNAALLVDVVLFLFFEPVVQISVALGRGHLTMDCLVFGELLEHSNPLRVNRLRPPPFQDHSVLGRNVDPSSRLLLAVPVSTVALVRFRCRSASRITSIYRRRWSRGGGRSVRFGPVESDLIELFLVLELQSGLAPLQIGLPQLFRKLMELLQFGRNVEVAILGAEYLQLLKKILERGWSIIFFCQRIAQANVPLRSAFSTEPFVFGNLRKTIVGAFYVTRNITPITKEHRRTIGLFHDAAFTTIVQLIRL
mmetsp:Transcript_27528/g.79382  ORF Transcript_27528/g.79382 Transcript_27528/m.79382 type:complete len:260 (+) Transcript_27528:2091-2870(+)